MSTIHGRYMMRFRTVSGAARPLQALLFVLLAVSSQLASAFHTGDKPKQALRGHVHILEDKNHNLDAESAMEAFRQGRFKNGINLDGDIAIGYSSAAIWLALPLKSASPGNTEYLLEIGHPPLDRAEFYTRLQGGGFTRQIAGDLLPFAARPFVHRNLVFPFTLRGEEENVVLIRITSEGSLLIPLSLWTPQALHEHDQRSYALISIYYGIVLALLLYNLMIWVATRDVVYLMYVVSALSIAIGQASLTGLGSQLLWPSFPGWGDVSLPIAMSAAGLFGAQFMRLFLETPSLFPKIDSLLLAWMAAFLIAIFTSGIISYRAGAVMTSLTGLSFAFVAIGVCLYCQAKGHRTVRFLLLGWFALLIGVAVQAMRHLGWVPTNLFTQYAMQAGSSLDLLLLSFALADRINQLRHAKSASDAALISSKQDLVLALQKNESELEARVTERTRDLLIANSRLQEKEQQLEYMARHDSLTGLANRSLLSIRMEHSLARARRSGRSAGVLLVDVDNFKLINDREGHLVGDQLLVKLSARLLESVRMTDTVARYGGDEFVVILEEVSSEEQARQVAMKLLNITGEKIILPSGKELRTTVSIGLALFPQNGRTVEELLRQADKAMFSAKAAGRNRWLAASPEPAP